MKNKFIVTKTSKSFSLLEVFCVLESRIGVFVRYKYDRTIRHRKKQ